MEGIEVIFWVILALIWLISGSLIRRRSRRERERIREEGEVYAKPEEELGRVAEEEVREIFEILEREEQGIPVSEPPSITLPSVKEPEVVETIEGKEVPVMEFVPPPALPMIPEMEELEIELTDVETLSRGILISEILGPPRAKKPFVRIRRRPELSVE